MDKTKLKKYKDLLLETKSDILKELELEQEYINYNEHGDLVDMADNLIQNEIISKLSDMDFEKINLIDAALEKIENGTYGICEVTGKNIPEARLNAIPWTRYSIEAAAEIEKERQKSQDLR